MVVWESGGSMLGENDKNLNRKNDIYNGDIEAVKAEIISLVVKEKRLDCANPVVTTLLTALIAFFYRTVVNDESFLVIVVVSLLISYVLVKSILEIEYASLTKQKNELENIKNKYEKSKAFEQTVRMKQLNEAFMAMSKLCAIENGILRYGNPDTFGDKSLDIEYCLSILNMYLSIEYDIKYGEWCCLAAEVLSFFSGEKNENDKFVLLKRVSMQQKEMKEIYEARIRELL